jgi:hypothetical protein
MCTRWYLMTCVHPIWIEFYARNKSLDENFGPCLIFLDLVSWLVTWHFKFVSFAHYLNTHTPIICIPFLTSFHTFFLSTCAFFRAWAHVSLTHSIFHTFLRRQVCMINTNEYKMLVINNLIGGCLLKKKDALLVTYKPNY